MKRGQGSGPIPSLKPKQNRFREKPRCIPVIVVINRAIIISLSLFLSWAEAPTRATLANTNTSPLLIFQQATSVLAAAVLPLFISMKFSFLQATCILQSIVFALFSGCLALSEFRGVHPREASRYAASHSSSFSCGDGVSISWERVNDDYCDCASGLDEPGTSGELTEQITRT